jgi:hypothetical protein
MARAHVPRGLQSVFPTMDQFAQCIDAYIGSPRDTTLALVEYTKELCLPAFERLDTRTDAIDIVAKESDDFSAKVRRLPNSSYEIQINTGLTSDIIRAIRFSNDGSATILSELAGEIFGDSRHAPTLAGSLLSFSLLFVLLHEYGHISAGHFAPWTKICKSGAASFEFDEMTDVLRYDGVSGNPDAFTKLAEIEADNLAFSLILDVGYPMFVANSDVAHLMRGREFANWRDEIFPPVAALSLYASSLVLALISARRNDEPGLKGYPLPITRMLNLSLQFLRRTVKGHWRSDDAIHHELLVDDAVLDQLTTTFVPSLQKSIQISLEGCKNVGLDLTTAHGFENVSDGISQLSSDFISLVKRDGHRLSSAEGRQLATLQNELGGFNKFMTPYRIRRWWS